MLGWTLILYFDWLSRYESGLLLGLRPTLFFYGIGSIASQFESSALRNK